MKVVEGIKAFGDQRPRVVVTIGNFDGVHLGHQALLSRVRTLAEQTGAESAVLTFEPHPSKVLRNMGIKTGSEIPRLMRLQDLTQILANFQIDWLIVEPFNEQFAKLTPEEFLNLLVRHVEPVGVVVGYDFAFGKDRAGKFEALKRWAQKRERDGQGRIIVEQISPLLENGEIVSSSHIRKSIISGAVEAATKALSRPYFIAGEVVPGEGRGKNLGFRTANINPDAELLPKNGVYVTRLYIEPSNQIVSGLESVTNIGRKPTFHDSYQLTVETHILNESMDLRGRHVRLEFLQRLRDELKFNSVDELIEQIRQDVNSARAYFGLQNV